MASIIPDISQKIIARMLSNITEERRMEETNMDMMHVNDVGVTWLVVYFGSHAIAMLRITITIGKKMKD